MTPRTYAHREREVAIRIFRNPNPTSWLSSRTAAKAHVEAFTEIINFGIGAPIPLEDRFDADVHGETPRRRLP